MYIKKTNTEAGRGRKNQLTVLPVPETASRFHKREADFCEVSRKIRTAWDAMGYKGDPIIELMSAIQGMSLGPASR